MNEKTPNTTIALIGCPNTGKTTIFNGLSGLRQHTGNWHGKTQIPAQGNFSMNHQEYQLIDLPGIYSAMSPPEREKTVWDYLNSGNAQILLMTCDASCLERDLYLLRQILSLDTIKDNGIPLILCINLWDEAEKKGIEIDLELLQDVLQVPVLNCCALHAGSLNQIRQAITDIQGQRFSYDCLDFCPKQLASETVRRNRPPCCQWEDMTDRIVIGHVTGILLTFLLLFCISWLSLTGTALPSVLLWNLLFAPEPAILTAMTALHLPQWLISLLVYGVYRSLAWILSILLPSLTIFFFLFTMLEELGCLPRIAFHLDPAFQRCHACGKQCFAIAMGFCCNAVGVTQCRMIDSPRERKIAILTNSFIPCSRRLPTLFLMVSLFFMAGFSHPLSPLRTQQTLFMDLSPALATLLSALLLSIAILLAIASALAASWFLSHTLLQGPPSPFILELPPYRCPQTCKNLICSFQSHTLPAIKRALAVTIPAVLLTWLFAFFCPTLFSITIQLLEPVGHLMGLDGIILFAYLLSLPANEIIMPVILTAYLHQIPDAVSSHILLEISHPFRLASFLSAHGWTRTTLLCMMVFCLFHPPCIATVLSIKKETGSWKWTTVSILLPTLFGTGLCILFASISHILFQPPI